MADHVYDTNYAMKEFTASGEIQMLNKTAGVKDFETVFDVGANIGEWARMLLHRQFLSKVHCFEPMPQVYEKLLTMARHYSSVVPNSFGLSDKIEMLDMLFDADNDRLTTPCLELARTEPEVLPLLMVDGDSYCESRKIEHIDLLKIDTEGHEFKVLKGFSHMLENGAISMIQFEYGYANVLTKDLLIDFYKLLTPLGYTLGLLTPEGVQFKTYGLLDENFRGPNYVAVHATQPELMMAIQVPTDA